MAAQALSPFSGGEGEKSMKLLPETFKMREQFSDSFVQVGLLVHEWGKVKRNFITAICLCVWERDGERQRERDDGEDWQKGKH